MGQVLPNTPEWFRELVDHRLYKETGEERLDLSPRKRIAPYLYRMEWYDQVCFEMGGTHSGYPCHGLTTHSLSTWTRPIRFTTTWSTNGDILCL